MWAIDLPIHTASGTYLSCVNSVSDENVEQRLRVAQSKVLAVCDQYEANAVHGSLHVLAGAKLKPSDLAVSPATRQDLEDLYSTEMLGRSKPSRAIYDSLRVGSKNGKCPTCGIGQVFTLDHFLPKARYPWFSVHPLNLVPACRDCNTGKSSRYSDESQSFHPYFDKKFLEDERWLRADLSGAAGMNITFGVDAPLSWTNDQRKRAEKHFQEYALGSRYGIEAASEITVLRNTFKTYKFLNLVGAKEHVAAVRTGELATLRNGWKAALYDALESNPTIVSNLFAEARAGSAAPP